MKKLSATFIRYIRASPFKRR